MARDRPNAVLAGLANLPRDAVERRVREFFLAEDRDLARDVWLARAHAGQIPAAADWRTWLILAGRGFGKTRAGAEWVQFHAMSATRETPCHIALVAATYEEARDVMVEGAAGILAVAHPRERPQWEPSKRRLRWTTGAEAHLYSGERPDGLRGGEHSFAWCDEIAKWSYPGAAWSNLQLALRQGARPRAVVTTTPRHGPFLTDLRTAPGTTETRGRTHDNPALPPGFITAVEALYAGTRLGRQELDGEILTDLEDALWTRAMIEACRLHHRGGKNGGRPDRHDWVRIVIGVDPASGTSKGGANCLPSLQMSGSTAPRAVENLTGSGSTQTWAAEGRGGPSQTGDACGIIAIGLRADGKAIVLEDASVPGTAPARWAAAVAACAEKWQADCVVAEANNGGRMVESVLHAADAGLPVKLVHAARGKAARAEPVAYLYQQGRVKHAHAFPELEDQLCGLTIHGYEGPGRSPDRADALVWAVTELKLGKARVAPEVRSLAGEVEEPVVRVLDGGFGVVRG